MSSAIKSVMILGDCHVRFALQMNEIIDLHPFKSDFRKLGNGICSGVDGWISSMPSSGAKSQAAEQ